MLLAWHHLLFEIPTTWEVIAHSKNPEKGQLVLSDRHGETMQVFWKRVNEKLDVRRRLIDLASASSEGAGKETEIRKGIAEVSGWQMFESRDEKLPTFAARYLTN